MKAGQWCITKDEENWMGAPAYDTREDALATAPQALGLKPGERFWLACAVEPASALCAELVVDALDQHAMDEGPEDSDGYEVSKDAMAELESLLSTWAAKHDVRPLWFDMDGIEEHAAPVAEEARP